MFFNCVTLTPTSFLTQVCHILVIFLFSCLAIFSSPPPFFSQAGMKHQLSQLVELESGLDPDMAHYLHCKDSGNFYFAFRWLLVWEGKGSRRISRQKFLLFLWKKKLN